MRRIILMLIILGLLVSAAGISAQATFINHIVVRGETLAGIAARYGTTWPAIAQLNNLPNPNRIYAGQILVIPVGQVVPPQPPAPPTGQTTIYRATWGDTLARIASYYDTTWQTLAGINGLANPNLIFSGQQLRVPVNPSRTAIYTVRWGDTLGSIAFRFSSSVGAITVRNGLVNPNVIFPGQVLSVPF